MINMVNYLDSRRIAGTTAERSSVPIPATSGGWVELGRTTLGSAGDNITVSSLANKRYYMILRSVKGTTVGGAQSVSRFGSGSISTSGYATRYNDNGGTDGTYTSGSFMLDGYDGNPELGVHYIANYSTKEKLMTGNLVSQNTAGAGTAPNRREQASKWTNTSNPIDIINLFNNGGADFDTGSELVVLGWDPSDTHTTNFWEELADVTLSSAGDTLSSGTITAKKYLWVQVYTKATGGTIQQRMRFNSDSGNNYSERYSQDGGADGVITNDGELLLSAAPSTPAFTNMFIINNQSNEKLVIGHNVNQGGVGAGNDPERFEFAHKWANTSNQITQIDIINTGTGDFDTNSFIKVWGSD